MSYCEELKGEDNTTNPYQNISGRPDPGMAGEIKLPGKQYQYPPQNQPGFWMPQGIPQNQITPQLQIPQQPQQPKFNQQQQFNQQQSKFDPLYLQPQSPPPQQPYLQPPSQSYPQQNYKQQYGQQFPPYQIQLPPLPGIQQSPYQYPIYQILLLPPPIQYPPYQAPQQQQQLKGSSFNNMPTPGMNQDQDQDQEGSNNGFSQSFPQMGGFQGQGMQKGIHRFCPWVI